MELTKEEREAVDRKFENPRATVKCPRCGSELKYKEFPTAASVKCEKERCIEVNIRGI